MTTQVEYFQFSGHLVYEPIVKGKVCCACVDTLPTYSSPPGTDRCGGQGEVIKIHPTGDGDANTDGILIISEIKFWFILCK